MKNIDLKNRCAVITGEAQGMGLVRGVWPYSSAIFSTAGRVFDLNYNRPNY